MAKDLELNWKVRLSNSETNQVHYQNAWNDDYLWNSMLPLAWSCIDISGISIRPSNQRSLGGDSHASAIAQWAMAIHLLGLGMGWTNIGKGLQTWAARSYGEGFHPILDFLAKNFGSEIEALEIYFGVSPRYQIREVLELFRTHGRGVAHSTSIESADSKEYEIRARQILEDINSPTRSLGQLLLNGGDALHLDSHCAKSFLGNENGGSFIGLDHRVENEQLVNVWTPWYGGWAHRLAVTSDYLKTDTLLGPGSKFVSVEIQDIGSLGAFVWNPKTSRWFRYTKHYRGFQQVEAHEWGN
jgi:hypothetical protein